MDAAPKTTNGIREAENARASSVNAAGKLHRLVRPAKNAGLRMTGLYSEP